MAGNKSVIVASSMGHRVEKVAAAAFTPGMLLEQTSANKFQAHSVAGGSNQRVFALEDSLRGNDIDDAYVADNQSFGFIARRGDLINALLADGETAVIGSKLVSNGDGYLKILVVDSAEDYEDLVGIAQEALDLSDSSGADPASQRLLIEVA